MRNSTLFTVAGFEVKEGGSYMIKDKKDLNAPIGFVKEGISKVPGNGIAETFHCNYISENVNTPGVWDSGFFAYSPCYRGQPSEAVNKEIENLMKNVVEPYQKAVGKPDALLTQENEFWESLRFEIHTKKIFNVDSPQSRLELYFALRSYQAAPMDKQLEGKYRNASYVVQDSTHIVKKEHVKSNELFKTIGLFMKMYETQKPLLFLILNYMGLTVSEEIDEETLVGMFKEFLDTSFELQSKFISLCKESEKEAGKAKFDIYKKLQKIAGRGGKLVKAPSGTFFYDEQEIGPDLKSAAENISKVSELDDVKKAILFGDGD